MQRGQALIFILVGVLLISAIAVGAIYLGKQITTKPKSQTPSPSPQSLLTPSPIPSTSPQPSGSLKTANLNTYTSTKYGFSFDYPKNLSLSVERDADSEFRLSLNSTGGVVNVAVLKDRPVFLKGDSEDTTSSSNITWTVSKESSYCGDVDISGSPGSYCNKLAPIYVTKANNRYYVLILRSISPSSETFKTILSTFQITGYVPKQPLSLGDISSCLETKKRQYATSNIALEKILVKFKDTPLTEAKQIIRSYGLEFDEQSNTTPPKTLLVKVPLGSELQWVCQFERNNAIQSAEPLTVIQISSR